MRHVLINRFLICLSFVFFIYFAFPSLAEDFLLDVGKGRVVIVPENTAAVFVADKEVADIQTPKPGQFFLYGRKVGSTSLTATGPGGEIIMQKTVVVQHDLTSARRALTERFPRQKIEVLSSEGSLLIRGKVADPRLSQDIEKTMRPFAGGGDVINRLEVQTSGRVRLYVRLFEIDRNIDDDVGVDWRALFGVGPVRVGVANENGFTVGGQFDSSRKEALVVDLNATVDLLASRGLITIVSEPNLTTVDGVEAEFKVGGEFPVPKSTVSAGGAVSDGVDFRFYGVTLAFTPKIINRDSILLSISSSISNLMDKSSSVDGNNFPFMGSRSFNTTINLASGQSFAVAGLFQKEERAMLKQLSVGRGIPLLRRLFDKETPSANQTELLVIATPYLMDSDVKTRILTQIGPRTNIEYLILGGRGGRVLPAPARKDRRLVGQAGFRY